MIPCRYIFSVHFVYWWEELFWFCKLIILNNAVMNIRVWTFLWHTDLLCEYTQRHDFCIHGNTSFRFLRNSHAVFHRIQYFIYPLITVKNFLLFTFILTFIISVFFFFKKQRFLLVSVWWHKLHLCQEGMVSWLCVSWPLSLAEAAEKDEMCSVNFLLWKLFIICKMDGFVHFVFQIICSSLWISHMNSKILSYTAPPLHSFYLLLHNSFSCLPTTMTSFLMTQ